MLMPDERRNLERLRGLLAADPDDPLIPPDRNDVIGLISRVLDEGDPLLSGGIRVDRTHVVQSLYQRLAKAETADEIARVYEVLSRVRADQEEAGAQPPKVLHARGAFGAACDSQTVRTRDPELVDDALLATCPDCLRAEVEALRDERDARQANP